MKAQAEDLGGVLHALRAAIIGARPLHDAASEWRLDPLAARRLAIYRRSYAFNVADGLTTLTPITERIAIRTLGATRWAQLVQEWGTRHPLPEIGYPTATLVMALLASCGHLLPEWLAELADLELWERRILSAPATGAPCAALLRVADPLVLRSFAFDVFSVRNAVDPTAAVACARPNVVALWRDVDGIRRTVRIGGEPLRVIRAVARGERLDGPSDRAARDIAVEATRRLHAISLLVGALPHWAA